MASRVAKLTCIAVLAPALISAQDYLSLGPELPNRLRLAPGQITTVFASTTDPIPVPVRADGFPLPRSLGGFSVEFQVLGSAAPILAPLLSVGRYSSCPITRGIPNPCATIAGISIQVPWELSIGVSGQILIQMSIVHNGRRGKFVDVQMALNQVHFPTGADPAIGILVGPLFVHADGTAIAAENPARSGEVATAYLFGLGRPSSPVELRSGEPSPAGAEYSSLALRYEFRPTRSAVVYPLIDDAGSPLEVRWAGLAPGTIGLYQVNFVVPRVPADLPECLSGGRGYSSNLTISFDGSQRFIGPIGSQAATAICAVPDRSSSSTPTQP